MSPKKWIRNKSDILAIKEGCWFDQRAADKVCSFFETFLHHSKGQWAGKPFFLEDWQRDYLSRLFGWKRKDGTRRFRESHLEVSKKNGKTSMLSGLCIFGLFEEPGAGVYCGAVDKSQASLLFDEACNMVEASPYLSKHLQCLRSLKVIVFKRNKASFRCMSSDIASKDGANCSLCVLDETHRYSTSDLYDIMKYAGIARRQPLIVQITSSGSNKNSFCYRKHVYSKGVNDGSIKDTAFLGVIYGADPKKVDEPAEWKRANPSWGSIINPQEFKREYAAAKESVTEWNSFLRLRLGVWTEQAVRWLDVQQWDKLYKNYELCELENRTAFAHLDLSATKDLTCLHLLFPMDDATYHSVPYFFVPKETKEIRSRRDKVSYMQWVSDGWIIETEGNVTDYDAIRAKIEELSSHYRFEKLGIDPWNAQQLSNQLADDGQDIVEYRQVMSNLSPPSKELERLLLSGRITNNGNPCMRWNVGHVGLDYDNTENFMPSKKPSKSPDRIDGVVSLVCALGLATSFKPVPEASIGYV